MIKRMNKKEVSAIKEWDTWFISLSFNRKSKIFSTFSDLFNKTDCIHNWDFYHKLNDDKTTTPIEGEKYCRECHLDHPENKEHKN